jgi:hypothetical protein
MSPNVTQWEGGLKSVGAAICDHFDPDQSDYNKYMITTVRLD